MMTGFWGSAQQQGVCEGPEAFSPENQKKASAARVQRKWRSGGWGGVCDKAGERGDGRILQGLVRQVEVFVCNSFSVQRRAFEIHSQGGAASDEQMKCIHSGWRGDQIGGQGGEKM